MRDSSAPIARRTGHANGHAKSPHLPERGNGAGRGIATHPRISIIVPALNEEKLIEQTLGCFPEELRSRYNIELIVSDGGSRDRTVELARTYADVVVEHHEPRRQTIAEGRNRGSAAATGDLLVFINADTIPRHPEKFMHALMTIAQKGEAGSGCVAYACPVEVAPRERRLSDRLFHGFFNNYVRFLNRIGVGMGRGECQVIWKGAFRAVGGYNDLMAAGEDFDLYKRLNSRSGRRGGIGHSWDLCVYESPRRFRRYGYLRVLLEWSMNALAVIFLRRSMSKEWEEIR